MSETKLYSVNISATLEMRTGREPDAEFEHATLQALNYAMVDALEALVGGQWMLRLRDGSCDIRAAPASPGGEGAA